VFVSSAPNAEHVDVTGRADLCARRQRRKIAFIIGFMNTAGQACSCGLFAVEQERTRQRWAGCFRCYTRLRVQPHSLLRKISYRPRGLCWAGAKSQWGFSPGAAWQRFALCALPRVPLARIMHLPALLARKTRCRLLSAAPAALLPRRACCTPAASLLAMGWSRWDITGRWLMGACL